MKTGTITFNVRERGRKFRGQERNFDTAAMADLINGPEVQERVKNRDLVGYYGHWPRVMFGMSPGEGGIYQGKQITLEPAIVTTRLRAMPDGTIEHEAEFLDTVPGRTAKRLFSSKSGGFSSAINCRELMGKDVPIAFHGFDYVAEPNFTTNRGYALDGVYDDAALVLDGVSMASESSASLRILDGLYTTLQGDYDRLACVQARMQSENAELVAMLAAMPPAVQATAKGRMARLDSAVLGGLTVSRATSPAKLAAEFKTLELAGFEAVNDATPDQQRELAQLDAVITGFFAGR